MRKSVNIISKHILSIMIIFILSIGFFFLITGCLYETEVSPQKIQVTSEYLTIAWDSPLLNMSYGPLSVVEYKLYYCVHGTSAWMYIDTIEYSQSPEYTLYHKDILGNGMYDFAVKAVYTDNRESRYHSSLDQTAEPFYGWYIDWKFFK